MNCYKEQWEINADKTYFIYGTYNVLTVQFDPGLYNSSLTPLFLSLLMTGTFLLCFENRK